MSFSEWSPPSSSGGGDDPANNNISNSRRPIIFYTSRITPSCRAVQMLAMHLNIELKEVTVRCYIDTRTEKFRKINPCHTLPVIDDDGFILWESRAIMQYLCNRYAPHCDLYPSDPQQRATVDRLLNFDLKSLSHAVMAVHYEFTFPGEYSASRGEKMVAVTDALTLLEIFLINRHYVACDHLTIADLSILASVTLLEVAVEFDLTSYPNIWSWYNRLRGELPYYDPLTKRAHDELRALIQNIRDAHEEWSSPLQKCAFVPGGDGADHADCHAEQHRQYQRLFLNANDKQDAARIMAAVSPAFRPKNYSSNSSNNSHNNNNQSITNNSNNNNHNQEMLNNGCGDSSGYENSNNNNNINDSNNGFSGGMYSGSQQQQQPNGSIGEPSSNPAHLSNISSMQARGRTPGPLMKRIRLTIEPIGPGGCLHFGGLDSPPIDSNNNSQNHQPNWSTLTPTNNSSNVQSPMDNSLLYVDHYGSYEDDRVRKVSSGSSSQPVMNMMNHLMPDPGGYEHVGGGGGGGGVGSVGSVGSNCTASNSSSSTFSENYHLCNETSCPNC